MTARTSILNSAEEVFARFGFEGASMRAIATGADVAQALLHYHFKTKEALFEAVIERRALAINTLRGELIDALFAKAAKPKLEALLEILLFPNNPAPENDPGNYSLYLQIISATSVAADERSKMLMERYFDGIALRFVDAFQRIVPNLSRERAAWVYLFALGARVQTSAPIDRARRLSAKARNADAQAAYALLVPFVAAGVERLAEMGVGKPPMKARKRT